MPAAGRPPPLLGLVNPGPLKGTATRGRGPRVKVGSGSGPPSSRQAPEVRSRLDCCRPGRPASSTAARPGIADPHPREPVRGTPRQVSTFSTGRTGVPAVRGAGAAKGRGRPDPVTPASPKLPFRRRHPGIETPPLGRGLGTRAGVEPAARQVSVRAAPAEAETGEAEAQQGQGGGLGDGDGGGENTAVVTHRAGTISETLFTG